MDEVVGSVATGCDFPWAYVWKQLRFDIKTRLICMSRWKNGKETRERARATIINSRISCEHRFDSLICCQSPRLRSHLVIAVLRSSGIHGLKPGDID